MIWILPWVAATVTWPFWYMASHNPTIAAGISIAAYGVTLAFMAAIEIDDFIN